MSSLSAKVLAFPLAFFALVGPLDAADLKISFAELTRLLQSIASNTRFYLNNVPGNLFANQSFVQVSSTQQYPVPIPAKIHHHRDNLRWAKKRNDDNRPVLLAINCS
jgi:hypothetical protein